MGSLLLDFLNPSCRQVFFYFWIDLFQNSKLFFQKGSTKIPLDTTGSFTFFEVANKLLIANIIRYKNFSNFNHERKGRELSTIYEGRGTNLKVELFVEFDLQLTAEVCVLLNCL